MPLISVLRRRLLAAMLPLASSLPLPAYAAAPYCQVLNTPSIEFGTVSPPNRRDVQTWLEVDCFGSTSNLIVPAQIRICVFIGEGSPLGMQPRRMSNGSGAYLNYDLYSDAARTRPIGPRNAAQYPLYSFNAQVSPLTVHRFSVPIYGRVHANQDPPATAPYKGYPQDTIVRYSYGLSFTHIPTEDQCFQGQSGHVGGAGIANFSWSGTFARMANTCRIATATDLDFGTVDGLPGVLEQTSLIQVSCSANTSWRVTLNDGLNALSGTRRMASGANRINYDLYRDAAHQQRWGNTSTTGVAGTTAEQSLTVHGRIPAQPDAPPGSYGDVITVTVTY